jgi:hypothetical protein
VRLSGLFGFLSLCRGGFGIKVAGESCQDKRIEKLRCILTGRSKGRNMQLSTLANQELIAHSSDADKKDEIIHMLTRKLFKSGKVYAWPMG